MTFEGVVAVWNDVTAQRHHDDQASEEKIQVHMCHDGCVQAKPQAMSRQAVTLLMIQVGSEPKEAFEVVFHLNGSLFTK